MNLWWPFTGGTISCGSNRSSLCTPYPGSPRRRVGAARHVQGARHARSRGVVAPVVARGRGVPVGRFVMGCCRSHLLPLSAFLHLFLSGFLCLRFAFLLLPLRACFFVLSSPPSSSSGLSLALASFHFVMLVLPWHALALPLCLFCPPS